MLQLNVLLTTEEGILQVELALTFSRPSLKETRARIHESVIRPLFFYFLVYGFLGRKNGSVGRKKKKKFQIIK